MPIKTDLLSIQGQKKESREWILSFIELVEEVRKQPLGTGFFPWVFSWDGEELQISAHSSFNRCPPEDQWFSLGILLEELDIRAAGVGVDLTISMTDQTPAASVKPTPSVAKGHPLAFAFHVRGARGENEKMNSVDGPCQSMRMVVEEPGLSLTLMDELQYLVPLAPDQERRSSVLGFILTEGKTPSILVRAGRAFERIQLLARIQGIGVEVLVDLVLRGRRCWMEGVTGFDFIHEENVGVCSESLAVKLPSLKHSFTTVAFRISKGVLPLTKTLVIPSSTPLIDSEGETPEASPTSLQIKGIVECARWAPSGDNVQPFTFEWNGKFLSVREDVGRSRSFLNVGNAASHIALGMCLTNIEIGAGRAGWEAHWTLGDKGNEVARVTFSPGPLRSSALEPAIFARTVDRRPYQVELIPPRYARELSAFIENPWGIRFHLINRSESVEKMALINGAFESNLFDHRAIHDCFYRWVRHSKAGDPMAEDGLPVSTLGIGRGDALLLRLLASWGVSRLFSALGLTRLATIRAQRMYKQSAAFGVFTVPRPDPLTFVRVGILWQKMWLKMTMDGWSLQPLFGNALMGLLCGAFGGKGLSAPQKARFIRDEKEMRDLIPVEEGETIASVFRMGRSVGPVVSRAPRRSVENLLHLISPTVAESDTFDYEGAFSRNLGLVQREEQQRLRKSVVAIAGLGGVGGVHATTLARLGIGHFRLADFDRFEIHNFNRQAGAFVSTLGREKVEVMAEQVLAINPTAEVRRFRAGVTAENVDAFLEGVDVVVDGLDFFVPESREILYDAAERKKIPLITAGPIGMSVAWLIFAPGGMRWRNYFRFDLAKSPVDKLILFALGLTPKATQMSYIDRASVDLPGHRGPSLALAVQLCSGVAAGEALKVILGRGRVSFAPTFHQFDLYRGCYVKGQLRRGNAGLIQRLKFHLARRWISQT